MNPLFGDKHTQSYPLSKFLPFKPPDIIVKRITELLCKMPVTFKVYEQQTIINVKAPFNNGMIVIIIQNFKTSGEFCLIDVKKWKVNIKILYLL